jgi:hypothetical protein
VDDAYAYGNEPIELEFELRPINCSSHASSPYESRGFFPRRIELDRAGPMTLVLRLPSVSRKVDDDEWRETSEREANNARTPGF